MHRILEFRSKASLLGPDLQNSQGIRSKETSRRAGHTTHAQEPAESGRAGRVEPDLDLNKRSRYPNAEDNSYGLSDLSLLTGFPGPVSYPSRRRAPVVQDAERVPFEPREQALQFYGQGVQPVFRSSPFAAEEIRRGAARTSVQVLFIDEGNCCRSVVAEAMFRKVLWKLAANGMPLDVQVESASLGPSLVKHDPRVERLMREAGLELPPRSARCFDEVKDMVEFDLVLVMDQFDFEEVMREVSVLDTINPGGFYSARLRQFGHFAAASSSFRIEKAPWVHREGIEDPLYGNVGGDKEQAALWGALRKLRLSCAGLAQYLSQLQLRCVAGTTLQQALSQALLCPLLDPSAPSSTQSSSWGIPEKGTDWRPVWRGEDADGPAQLFSLRVLEGRRMIVRRPDPFYKVQRGYWRDLQNLKKELEGWLDLHGSDRGRLPTNRELRESGASQICNAIEYHGGYFAVAQKLSLKAVKRNGRNYLTEPRRFQQELTEFVQQSAAKGSPDAERMPSIQELKRNGRADLAYAISKLGGITKAAEICSLQLSPSRQKRVQPPRQPTISLVHAQELLWSNFPETLRRGHMPSRTQLIDSGNRQLAREITDLGGFKAVSEELGLQYCRAARNTSKQSQSSLQGVTTP